jgi:tetratricopeptide (TPR) repeat protein
MTEQKFQLTDFAAHADRVAEHNQPFLLQDFTPASIAALDCFIDESWGESGESPETEEWQPSDGKWNTILNFGIYFGEVMIRRYGGEWVRYEPQPDSMLNIGVVFPNGMKVFPVAKVWKRFKNGVEDSIDPLYRWVRTQMKDEPPAGEWQEWLNQGNWFMKANRPDRAISFFKQGLTCPLTDRDKRELETALQIADEAARIQADSPDQPDKAPRSENIPEPAATQAPKHELNQQQVSIARVRHFLAAHDHESAYTATMKALELLPDVPELNELMGDLLAQRKDIPGAMAAFLKGTRRWESARSWEGLGICRNLTGDPDGAVVAWQEASQRDTKRSSPCFRLALLEEQRGNKLKALEWYRLTADRATTDEKQMAQAKSRIHALENDPDQLRQQADRCADQGDTAGAVAVYEKIAANNPKDSEAWREAGVGYAMLQQFDKALNCLDSALKADSRDDMAWDFKAVTLARMGKNPAGLSVVDDGLSNCLGSARLWARRAYILGTLQRHQESLTSAGKALELDPDYGSAYLFKFDAERKLGRTAEALQSINRHIAWIHPHDHKKGIESMKLKWELENPGGQLDSQQAAELQEHAFQYWQNGNLEQSLEAYVEATKLDPFSHEIWNNYGIALSAIGRHEEAIACFNHAHELYPLITDFLANKAVALSRLLRNDEALTCHEQILQKYVKSEKSLDARTRLLSVMERHEEALSAAEAFLGAYPDRSLAHVRHSWALQKLGRNEEALGAIDRAISCTPDDRNLWLRKSMILGDLGRNEEAEDLQSLAFKDKEFAEKYHQEGLSLFKSLGV